MLFAKIAPYFDTRSLFFRLTFHSPLRPFLNILHRCIVTIQIRILQYLSSRGSQGALVMDDTELASILTIIIKTFERPYVAKRLVKSIRKYYPTVTILIADDSERPVIIPTATTISLPYNSGVGLGRSACLDAVKTEFVVNLDDDFVFSHATDLVRAVGHLRRYSKIDLIGGSLINLPFLRRTGSGGAIGIPRREPLIQIGSTIGRLVVSKKVPQFYVARTKSLHKVLWDKDIKCLDHLAFFHNAYGRIVCAHDPKLPILHARTPFDYRYMRERMNFAKDIDLLRKRYLNGSL
jgi:hypothetical protein